MSCDEWPYKLSVCQIKNIVEEIVNSKSERFNTSSHSNEFILEISRRKLFNEKYSPSQKSQPKMFSELNEYLDFWEIYALITNRIKQKLQENFYSSEEMANFTPNSNFLFKNSIQVIEEPSCRENLIKTQNKIQVHYGETIKTLFAKEVDKIDNVMNHLCLEDKLNDNDGFEAFILSKISKEDRCKSAKEKKNWFNFLKSKNNEVCNEMKLNMETQYREDLGTYNRLALSMLNLIVERKKKICHIANTNRKKIKTSTHSKFLKSTNDENVYKNKFSQTFNTFSQSIRPQSSVEQRECLYLSNRNSCGDTRGKYSFMRDSIGSSNKEGNIFDFDKPKKLKKTSAIHLEKEEKYFYNDHNSTIKSTFNFENHSVKLKNKRSIDLFYSVEKSIKCIKEDTGKEPTRGGSKMKKVNISHRHLYQTKMQKIFKELDKQDNTSRLKKPIFDQFMAATSKQLNFIESNNVDEINEIVEEVKPRIANMSETRDTDSWISVKTIKSLKQIRGKNNEMNGNGKKFNIL